MSEEKKLISNDSLIKLIDSKQLALANPKKRVMARLIDELIFFMPLFVLWIIFFSPAINWNDNTNWWRVLLFDAYSIIFYIFYFIFIPFKNGKTIGKSIYKINYYYGHMTKKQKLKKIFVHEFFVSFSFVFFFCIFVTVVKYQVQVASIAIFLASGFTLVTFIIFLHLIRSFFLKKLTWNSFIGLHDEKIKLFIVEEYKEPIVIKKIIEKNKMPGANILNDKDMANEIDKLTKYE